MIFQDSNCYLKVSILILLLLVPLTTAQISSDDWEAEEELRDLSIAQLRKTLLAASNGNATYDVYNYAYVLIRNLDLLADFAKSWYSSDTCDDFDNLFESIERQLEDSLEPMELMAINSRISDCESRNFEFAIYLVNYDLIRSCLPNYSQTEPVIGASNFGNSCNVVPLGACSPYYVQEKRWFKSCNECKEFYTCDNDGFTSKNLCEISTC